MDFIPPSNREVEEGVLADCLLSQEAAEFYTRDLCPEDFYFTFHRKIFEAITILCREGSPVELPTLFTQMRTMKQEFGVAQLGAIIDAPPLASREWAISELRKKRNARSAIELANALQKRALDPSADIAETIEFVRQAAEEIKPYGSTPRSACTIASTLPQAFDRYDEVARNPGQLRGVETGYSQLNFLTGGLRKKDLTLLAARPSMGKTALACNIVRRAARAGFKVAFFSYEQPAQQLVDRMISDLAMVDLQRMSVGPLSPDDLSKLNDAAEEIHELPIIFDEDSSLKTVELEQRMNQYAAKLGGLDLVVVDHLQIFPANDIKANTNTQLGQISKDLKNIAKRANVAMMALSQLNRGLESRSDPRPRMSDLRESGNLEQNADTVIFIFRPKYYKMQEDYKNQAEVYLGKNRQGPIGGCNMIFRDEIVRFDLVDLRQIGH